MQHQCNCIMHHHNIIILLFHIIIVIIYTKKLLNSDWLRKECSSSVTRVQTCTLWHKADQSLHISKFLAKWFWKCWFWKSLNLTKVAVCFSQSVEWTKNMRAVKICCCSYFFLVYWNRMIFLVQFGINNHL